VTSASKASIKLGTTSSEITSPFIASNSLLTMPAMVSELYMLFRACFAR
jgi:hypothetical protein